MPVWGCICIYVPLYTSSFWMPTSYSIEQMQPTSLSGDQHLCFPNSCYCEQCTNEYCSCMFILLSIFLNINLRNGIWGSKYISVQFSSVQSLSHVQLFATPWIAACQASLSITNSQSSPRLTSIESVMPSSHLILCRPLLLLLSIFPSIRVFTSGGQSIEVSASTSVLPMNTQHWSPLGWTGCISWQSKGLSRVFWVASPGSMHDTGCLRLVHWDDPEGWYGERGGRGSGRGTRVYLWRIHIDVCQNQYNNVINLQFNKFIFKKNKIIFKKPLFPVSIDWLCTVKGPSPVSADRVCGDLSNLRGIYHPCSVCNCPKRVGLFLLWNPWALLLVSACSATVTPML